MTDLEAAYLVKARLCLVGAQSEQEHGRYDNAANRAYYACVRLGTE